MASSTLYSVVTNGWTITIIGGIIVGVILWLLPRHGGTGPGGQRQKVIINNYPSAKDQSISADTRNPGTGASRLQILFIDDDLKFPIVKILRKQEFIKAVEIITDIGDFGDQRVLDADAIFVDVEGVGRILTPEDEGLGLALEIKNHYPAKKVFLYSTNPQRDITHPAIRAVDGLLRKTAQPAEFIRVLELLKDGA